MQRVVIKMNLTAAGAANLELLPQFCDMVVRLWEKAGGELELFDITTGSSDLIACGSFPSSLHALQFSAALSSDGYVDTDTSYSVSHRDASDVKNMLPLVHGTLTPEKKLDQES